MVVIGGSSGGDGSSGGGGSDDSGGSDDGGGGCGDGGGSGGGEYEGSGFGGIGGVLKLLYNKITLSRSLILQVTAILKLFTSLVNI